MPIQKSRLLHCRATFVRTALAFCCVRTSHCTASLLTSVPRATPAAAAHVTNDEPCTKARKGPWQAPTNRRDPWACRKPFAPDPTTVIPGANRRKPRETPHKTYVQTFEQTNTFTTVTAQLKTLDCKSKRNVFKTQQLKCVKRKKKTF